MTTHHYLRTLYSIKPETMETATSFGKRWTPEEDAKLLDELKTPTTTKEIASKHGRTAGAILSRQLHIAVRLITKENMSIEEAAGTVRRPVYAIQKHLNMRQNPNEQVLEVVTEIRDLLRELVALARD